MTEPTRAIRAMTAPTGNSVITGLVPALARALDGAGPALLPLPTGANRRALLDALRPDLPLEVDDVALVVPTSGSTGAPKGTLLTADAVRASAAATHERLGGPGQWVLALPVTHVAGLMVLARSLLARRSPQVVDVYGGFDVGAFAAATGRLDSQHPCYTSLVPTQLHRLLDAGADLTPYDAILLGGAAAPEPLLRRAAEAGAPVVVTYGMTETCGGCVYDGRPLDGVDVALGDTGRVRIAGPILFSGYRLRPDLTAEALVDGRHLTHDLGRWAADGRLEILGRTDDVIVSGGVNVSAARVEQVLNAHPDVRQCVVVGRLDDEWGEHVVAVIEVRAQRSVPSVDGLRAFAARALEAAALPRELVVVGALPMLAPGKPDRAGIRTLVAGS